MTTRTKAFALPLALTALTAACSPVTYTQDFDRGVAVPSSGTWAWMSPAPEDAEALAEISPFLQRRIERAVERELAESGYARATDGPADYLVAAYPILPSRGERSAYAAAPASRSNVTVAFGVGVGPAYGWAPYGWGRPYGYWGGAYGWGWPSAYWAPAAWSFRAGSIWGLPYFGYPGYGWVPGVGYAAYSVGGSPRPGVFGTGDRGYGSLVVDVIDPETGAVVWESVAAGALLDMPAGEAQDAYVDDVVRRMLEDFPPR